MGSLPLVVAGYAELQISIPSLSSLEIETNLTYRTISMLGNYDISDVRAVGSLGIVDLVAIDKHDDVSVLLNAVMCDYF